MMRAVLLAFALAAACAGVDGRLECKEDQDCLEGYSCDLASKQCLTTCTDDNACLASEYCDIPAGETRGLCRFGSLPGGDPAGGD
jgi:hypothetical protein